MRVLPRRWCLGGRGPECPLQLWEAVGRNARNNGEAAVRSARNNEGAVRARRRGRLAGGASGTGMCLTYLCLEGFP